MNGAPAPSGARLWPLTWRFVQRIRPYLGRLLLTLLVIFVASGAKAFQSFLFKPLLDHTEAVPSAPPSAEDPGSFDVKRRIEGWIGDPAAWGLGTIVILAVVASVFMFVFGYLRDVLTNYLSQRIVANVRNDVAEHLAYLPLRYHYDRKAGDLVSRTTNDVTLMLPAANFFFDDALVHPVMILCALGMVLYSNWVVAVAAIVAFPLYALPLVWLARRMRKARKRSLERFGEMTGTMIETFGGIKTVKAFNREAAQVKEFREHNEGYFRKLMAAVRRKALGENVGQLFLGFGIVGFFAFSGLLISKDKMTPGDMVILGLGVAMMNSSVRELTKSYNRLVEASAGCERVFEMLDTPRETGHESGVDPGEVTEIEYRNVGFAYDDAPVLRDINLKVLPGQMVAVVGRTGSGKTTMLDLLCRFYEPREGEILVSGRNLKDIRRSSLLSRIAVVTQETFLFNATIGENILYGRPDASVEEVREAAKRACIHDFIASLENGYDTRVGERGAKLSGGQRQRLSIARAILKNPSILILDEATSSLDAESERAVQQGLSHLRESGKRITLVIAHRLSTVRDADRILVIDQGRIVEEGRHDALLAREGVYASLYRDQFSDTPPA